MSRLRSTRWRRPSRLTTDPAERVRLAASRLSLSFKLGASGSPKILPRVSASADSLLDKNAEPKTPEIAGFLAPVAAMAGRCALTGKLLRQSAPSTRRDDVPADIMSDIMELQGTIAAGCRPPDAWRRLDDISRRLATSHAKEKEYMLPERDCSGDGAPRFDMGGSMGQRRSGAPC